MKTAPRLAGFGAGLVVAFGAAFGLASVIVPDSVVVEWEERRDTDTHGDDHDGTERKSAGHPDLHPSGIVRTAEFAIDTGR
jgi:hypothetical protein